jgi:hypothetical protein
MLVGVVIALFSFPARELSPGQRFFSSLRIAKPKPVSASLPASSGPGANRQVQALIGGMLAESTTVILDEPDVTVPSADSASRFAGFAVRLPRTRTDPPTISVLGARIVSATVNLGQLRTLLVQAGRPDARLPETINGAVVTIKTPRGIRVQYGNCPAPVANTIQSQIQGPPPPTTDNGNCVVLTETPLASIATPAGLDVDLLVEIALQLAGMSPNQTAEFQRRFDAKATLSMSLLRSMRSFDTLAVNGTRGMLLNSGGRRGPTYELVWVENGMVCTLTGYGSSADAVPLAKSAN